MEYKVEDFTDEKMGMICSWFQYIVDMACKLTTGNVAHQGATIRNYARSYIEYITDFYINDDWHPYDRQDHSTAPPDNEVVLTHLETGGVVAQRYSECYGRFDINNLVDKYKYVRLNPLTSTQKDAIKDILSKHEVEIRKEIDDRYNNLKKQIEEL